MKPGGSAAEHRSAFHLAIIVSLGGFVFGYDAVVISGVAQSVVRQFGLTDWQMGWIVAAPTLTAMFASLAAGHFSDRFGRRTMLRVVSALYILSSILSALAPNFIGLLLARGVGGLAFSSLVIAPVYLAEISPSRIRGRVVSMNQLAIVLGLSAAYFSNLLIQTLSQSGFDWVVMVGMDRESWRWMLGAELLPAFLWFVALMTMTPESPRWLILRGRIDEAKQVLARLFKPDHAAAVLDRVLTLGGETKQVFSLSALLTPRVKAALGFGLIVGIAQQITGVNAIYFYAPTVFQQTGIGSDAALLQAVIVGLTNVVFTITAMLLVDRVGRKPLLLFGLGGVAISLVTVALAFSHAVYALTPQAVDSASEAVQALDLAVFYGQEFSSDVALKTALIEHLGADAFRMNQAELLSLSIHMNAGIILAGILLFVASFAVSLGPVTWVFLSEIFPNSVRGTAIALVAFVNSLVSFTVQLVFPAELAALGAMLTFLIYGLAAAFFFVLVALFLPETRGRTLEATEAGDTPARV